MSALKVPVSCAGGFQVTSGYPRSCVRGQSITNILVGHGQGANLPSARRTPLLTHTALAALSATWACSPEPWTAEISAWLVRFTPCQTSGDTVINCKATRDNKWKDSAAGCSIFWCPQKHQKTSRHDTELCFCSAAETCFLPKFCLASFPSFEQGQLPRNRGNCQ